MKIRAQQQHLHAGVMNSLEWQKEFDTFMATHKTFAASVIIEIIKHYIIVRSAFIAGHVFRS